MALKPATVKDSCDHCAVHGFISDEDEAVDLEELMRGAEETTSSVEETSMAIGGNSNWSSQDSGSRATTFSMSLASISAAASEPKPSDELMADLDGDALIAHGTATEDRAEKALPVVAHED